jgi:alpha-tubulin suppressor-like RCC1 family protein
MRARKQTQEGRWRRLGLAACPARRSVRHGQLRIAAFRARRFLTVMVVVVTGTVSVAPSALAYWSSTGAGSATGTAGTLPPPTAVAGSESGSVTVTWTAPTPPAGVLSGYTVTRFAGVTPSNACGTDPASSATFIPDGTFTCNDVSVAAGTYTYTVTAVWRTWTAQSVASSTVTVTRPLIWFGDGQYGQGGIANFAAEQSPGQESTSATSWTALDAGGSHTCGIRTGGTLWCWGLNANGQLGIGSTIQRADPTQVTGTTWATVAVGGSHTCATKTNGTLWCWGLNTSGQLGDTTLVQKTSPVQVGVATTWTSVSAGGSHTCAIQSSGGNNTLWCWGLNANGQVGNGGVVTPQSTPVQAGAATTWSSVSAGTSYTCGTQTGGTNNTLWCWGLNTNGQIGDNTVVQKTSPTQIGVLTTWTIVSAGGAHTCGRKSDSSLWCWGLNANGQLGDATVAQKQVPTQIAGTTWTSVSAGGSHTCATKTSGGTTLWCWGWNTTGQLGDATVVQKTSPVQVGLLTTWGAVAAGGTHTCALQAAGTLWCWGNGYNGQLGNGAPHETNIALQVGANLTWATAAIGVGHTCAIRTDHTMWCVGYNANGELGQGDLTARSVPVQVAGTTWNTVAAGGESTCATTTDFKLWCWGENTYGEIGMGGVVTPQKSPVQVIVTGAAWNSVAAGAQHACATTTGGALYCWGNNTYGQVGNGGVVTPQSTPVQVAGTTWRSVAAGLYHTCATTTASALYCWGQNTAGQIGNGGVVSPQSTPVQIAGTTWGTVSTGQGQTCATKIASGNTTLWCWGFNTTGQVGNGGVVSPQTSPVQISVGVNNWSSVAAGYEDTCATRADSTLWCWGGNSFGQLGLGDKVQRTSPTQVPGLTVSSVILGSQSFGTLAIS